jgi:hypothetical protein
MKVHIVLTFLVALQGAPHWRASSGTVPGECLAGADGNAGDCRAANANNDGDSDDSSVVVDEECKDMHENCPLWAQEGECSMNPKYMTAACRSSCFLCVSEEDRQELEPEHL